MERSALPAEAMEGMFGSVPAMSTIVRFEHRTDAVDGEAEPARDLPVRRLERAGVDRSRLIASRHGLWSAHLPLSPTPARRLAPRARALRTSVSPGPAFLGAAPRSSPYVHSVDLLWSAQERQALTRRNSRLSF